MCVSQSTMDAFNAFVRHFLSEDEFKDLLKNDVIITIGKQYYAAPTTLCSIKESIKRDAYAIGVPLGESRERFYPTSALIERIAAYPASSNKKIFVNAKAEWLFLCGRSILQESITRNPHHISDGMVLVQNARDENLGYGVFKQEGKDLVIKNLLDRGSYLRVDEKRRGKR